MTNLNISINHDAESEYKKSLDMTVPISLIYAMILGREIAFLATYGRPIDLNLERSSFQLDWYQSYVMTPGLLIVCILILTQIMNLKKFRTNLIINLPLLVGSLILINTMRNNPGDWGRISSYNFLINSAIYFGLIILILTGHRLKKRILEAMLWVPVLASLALGLFYPGIGYLVTYDERNLNRLAGIFSHPNYLALFSYILVISITLRAKKSLDFSMLTIPFLAIFLSGSRGGFMAIIVFLISLGFRMQSQRPRKPYFSALLLFLGTLFPFFVTNLFSDTRFLGGRELIWNYHLNSGQIFTFLGNRFDKDATKVYFGSKVFEAANDPHNLFLSIILNSGFISFLILMFYSITTILKSGFNRSQIAIVNSMVTISFVESYGNILLSYFNLIGVIFLIHLFKYGTNSKKNQNVE